MYDINMNYLDRLSKGGELFKDFAFNTDASIIYCACSNMNLIFSYSNPNLTNIKEYKTHGIKIITYLYGWFPFYLNKILRDTSQYFSSIITEIDNLAYFEFQ